MGLIACWAIALAPSRTPSTTMIGRGTWTVATNRLNELMREARAIFEVV